MSQFPAETADLPGAARFELGHGLPSLLSRDGRARAAPARGQHGSLCTAILWTAVLMVLVYKTCYLLYTAVGLNQDAQLVRLPRRLKLWYKKYDAEWYDTGIRL